MRVLGLSTSVSVVYCLFRNFGRLFVARNIEDIQQDLDLTIAVFTAILDQPDMRGYEAGIVLQAYLPDSLGALQRLQEPQVKQILTGVAAVVAVGVLIGLARSRRRSKDLKELQRLLSNR